MSNIFTIPRAQYLAGAKLHFYATGTTTPQNTYTDIDLSVAHANPVVADANGYFEPIYLDPSLPDYRVKLATSADVQVWQYDDIPASQTSSQSFRLSATAPVFYIKETDGALNNKTWRLIASGEQLILAAGDDAESSWTSIMTVDRTGTTVDSTEIPALTVGGFSAASKASGSFTGTQTGYASDLTPTIQYRRSGTTVTLSTATSSLQTSNATTMTLAGIPAAIRPTQTLTYITRLTDNGTVVLGTASISTGGTITFGNGITAGNFTNSGNKGLPSGWTLTYEMA